MYLGAFLGGAIGGWVSLYASPAVGAAVGNGTATLTGELLELLTKKIKEVFLLQLETQLQALHWEVFWARLTQTLKGLLKVEIV